MEYGGDGQLEKTVGIDSWERHRELITGLEFKKNIWGLGTE
jgi:hypothetical protein